MKLQPEACNIIKKETLARVFSCQFYCKVFSTEHLQTTASEYGDFGKKNIYFTENFPVASSVYWKCFLTLHQGSASFLKRVPEQRI